MPNQHTDHFPQLDDSWMKRGSCRGTGNVDRFFPGRGQSQAEPIALCTSCPVREECAEFAITGGWDNGIWGGLNGDQRIRIRAQRVAALAAGVPVPAIAPARAGWIEPRDGKHRARVRYADGSTASKTFVERANAEAWLVERHSERAA